jgi:hypothetical protein
MFNGAIAFIEHDYECIPRHANGVRVNLGAKRASIGEILAHKELRKEAGGYAHRSNTTAGGCSNRGSLDSLCPETIELYHCHLSNYIWHSWVDPLIGTRIFYN